MLKIILQWKNYKVNKKLREKLIVGAEKPPSPSAPLCKDHQDLTWSKLWIRSQFDQLLNKIMLSIILFF